MAVLGVSLPVIAREVGITEILPQSLPVGTQWIRLHSDRSTWPIIMLGAPNLISATAEVSMDGGLSWTLAVGFTSGSNINTQEAFATSQAFPPSQVGWQVKARLEVLSPVTTGLTIESLP